MRSPIHARSSSARSRRRRGVLRRFATTALVWFGACALLLQTASVATGSSLAAPSSGPTRPAGLIQAGNSKTPCIYAPLAKLPGVEAVTGVTYRCLVTFVTGSDTWPQWQDPWLLRRQYGYVGWVAAAPESRTLVISMNLVPNDVAHTPAWRQEGAEGRFEAHARRLARNLVRAGLGYSVIRLGPEMNGPWEVDWIGPTTTDQRAWARAFANTVTAMRQVPGAHFLFDWDVNAGYEDIPLTNFYPGNAVVNIVGIDAYDEAPIKLPPVGSPKRWPTLIGEPLGLLDVYAFARAHGKPASIPEWGTLSTNGDDGQYVREMGAFIATHVIAYQAWYDAGDNHIYQLSARQAPKSFAAYASRFRQRTS